MIRDNFVIERKIGTGLTNSEHKQMVVSLLREFDFQFPPKENYQDTLFFLLKNGDEIISMGGLKKVKPVLFNEEEFSLMGFIEVVSNIKGKGYGKRLLNEMRKYLIENNKTGIGFTKVHNQGFYEKCGFKLEPHSTQRFVYKTDMEEITDTHEQIIFYQEGQDRFMTKVIANPEEKVYLPTKDLW